jgi:hypothetical protein
MSKAHESSKRSKTRNTDPEYLSSKIDFNKYVPVMLPRKDDFGEIPDRWLSLKMTIWIRHAMEIVQHFIYVKEEDSILLFLPLSHGDPETAAIFAEISSNVNTSLNQYPDYVQWLRDSGRYDSRTTKGMLFKLQCSPSNGYQVRNDTEDTEDLEPKIPVLVN